MWFTKYIQSTKDATRVVWVSKGVGKYVTCWVYVFSKVAREGSGLLQDAVIAISDARWNVSWHETPNIRGEFEWGSWQKVYRCNEI
jgi:hypothetical protein